MVCFSFNMILQGTVTFSRGQDWVRQRLVLDKPVHNAVVQHAQNIYDACEKFTQKVYNIRNYQDEISKDLYKELHKWAFDCMGENETNTYLLLCKFLMHTLKL